MNSEHAEAVALIEAQMAHFGAEARKMPRAEACKMAASFETRTGAIQYLLRAAQWTEEEKAELDNNIRGLLQWGAMSVRTRLAALEMIVYNMVPF